MNVFVYACMFLQLQACFGVYVCCIINVLLMSTINEKVIRPEDIWVSNLWQVIFVFGVTECVFWKTLIMCLYFIESMCMFETKPEGGRMKLWC